MKPPEAIRHSSPVLCFLGDPFVTELISTFELLNGKASFAERPTRQIQLTETQYIPSWTRFMKCLDMSGLSVKLFIHATS